MKKSELNKIITNVRIGYPEFFAKFKKETRKNGMFLQNAVNNIMIAKGYTSYSQIMSSCPSGIKLGYFLTVLLD